MATLVLDEQLANPRLVQALRERGLDVATVGDFGVTGRPDPDVVRRIAEQQSGPWILVTMDLTIVQDHPGFDWLRYAIAWVRVHKDLTGGQVEVAKTETIQRHAHTIKEQTVGDHFTYSAKRCEKHPPSLASMMEKRT